MLQQIAVVVVTSFISATIVFGLATPDEIENSTNCVMQGD